MASWEIPYSWSFHGKTIYIYWLMVSIILKHISQWEGLSHILLKIKYVWNHQPVLQVFLQTMFDYQRISITVLSSLPIKYGFAWKLVYPIPYTAKSINITVFSFLSTYQHIHNCWLYPISGVSHVSMTQSISNCSNCSNRSPAQCGQKKRRVTLWAHRSWPHGWPLEKFTRRPEPWSVTSPFNGTGGMVNIV